jgi:PAS domain S-box-containing protein
VNPPEVRDNRRRIVESVFSSGQPEVFEDEFSGKTMENRIFPVKNARGHVDMVAVFSRDMTERRRAEQAVRESEERFRRIFEESSVGIAIVSLEGRFIRTNPAFQNIIGYSDTELLQMKFLDITHPDHRDQDAQEVARLARGELQRYVTNKRYVRKDGSRMWAHVTVSVVRDPAGKPMYFIPLVDDITNLHKAEQEMVRLDKLESLSVLAGGLAHDFNNLLTAIMGNISLVQSDPSTGEKSTQRLRSAEAASLRARDLTQQLLTFSRGGTPDRKPVCLRSTVIESAEFATHGSRVRCEFRLPDDMWSVEADSGQISQVFSNLVINGVHAMPDGGVIEIGAKNEVVTVDTRPALAPGRYLHLWVRDSGVGIPPEHLAKIYDPYFTTKQNGVGLGLATAYSIIRHHAGILEAESAPGAGTTFHILIPALPEGTALPGEDAQEIVHGKGRILLMDDEESVREIGAGMLQSLGYGVETVPEGRLALSAYKKAMDSGTPFSAVILDLTIPAGMGGLETLAKLRELDPHARVVVSSGYSGDMVLGDYRARGFNEVLAKPYRLKDMSALLGRLLA